jgi:hypothetical protein
MTYWSTTIDGITVDNVTHEARYRGRWYPSFSEAVEAKREYEQARDRHLEDEMDRQRDEGDDPGMDD